MEEREVTLNIIIGVTNSYFQVWYPEGMVMVNTPSCPAPTLAHFRVGPAVWFIPSSGEQHLCYVSKVLMHHFFFFCLQRRESIVSHYQGKLM